MPSIAIACPSRGRPDRFRSMVDSALETAEDPDRIAVHVGLDQDDPKREDYDTSDCHVTIFERRIGVPSMTQRLIDSTDADYVMLGGDDCLYRTKGWDEKIILTFERYIPDQLGVLSFDNGNGRAIPEAICVSRGWLKAVHPLFMEGFEHFWVDAILMEIACRFERLFCLHDVMIEHMHFKYGKSAVDDTYAEKRTGGVDDRDRKRYDEVRPEIEEKIRQLSADYGLKQTKGAKTWRSHYRQ